MDDKKKKIENAKQTSFLETSAYDKAQLEVAKLMQKEFSQKRKEYLDNQSNKEIDSNKTLEKVQPTDLKKLKERSIPDYLVNSQGSFSDVLVNKGEINDELEIHENYYNKDKTEEFSTFITLTHDGLDDLDDNHKTEIIGLVNITSFDREVLDAVSTLYDAGNTSFTPIMIYKVMCGLSSDTYVKEDSCKHIIKSIEKLKRLRLSISSTHSLVNSKNTQNNKVKNKKLVRNATLLQIEEIQYEESYLDGDNIDNIKTHGYIMLQPPIIFQYAKEIHQIRIIPSTILNSCSLKNTPLNISIRGYLIRLIERNKDFQTDLSSCNLVIDDLYKYVGKEDSSRQDKKLVRNKVFAYLDSWIKCGYIQNLSSCNLVIDDLYKYVGKEDSSRQDKKLVRNKVFAYLDSWIKCGYIQSYEKIEGKRNSILGANITYFSFMNLNT